MHEAISGYSFVERISVPAHPATDGFTLKKQIIPRTIAAGTAIAITATADGDEYVVNVPPSTTVSWEAGEYSWQSWVEKTGERYPVDSGLLTIKDDPLNLDTYDARTPAEIALAACKAAFANFNASGGRTKRYVIGTREMEFSTTAEFIVEIDRLQAEVTREHAMKAIHDGKPDPRRVLVRMNNA